MRPGRDKHLDAILGRKADLAGTAQPDRRLCHDLALGNDGFHGELAIGPVHDALGLFGAGLVAGQTGNDKDDPAVPLNGRTDKAVTSLLGVAGFQAVRADPKSEKRVAVVTIGGRAIVEAPFLDGEVLVIFGKVLDQMLGQDAKIVHRHPMPGIGPARCIRKGRIGQAERLAPFRHLPRKGGFGSGKAFGHHDAGIIARQNDNALDQFGDRGAILFVQEHGRSLHLPRLGRDGQAGVKLKPAFLERLEQHVDRHQLGHRSRGQRLIGVLFHQHGAGRDIIDPCRPGIGVESPRRQRGKHDQSENAECQSAHGKSLTCRVSHMVNPAAADPQRRLGASVAQVNCCGCAAAVFVAAGTRRCGAGAGINSCGSARPDAPERGPFPRAGRGFRKPGSRLRARSCHPCGDSVSASPRTPRPGRR